MNTSSTSGLQVNRVSFLHGWLWLKYGFATLMRSPAQLLLLMAMMVMLTNLLASLGLIGVVVAKGMMPVLLVSYLSLLHRLAPSAASLGMPSSAPPGSPPMPADAQQSDLPDRTTPANGKPRVSLESVFSWAKDRKALGAVIQLGMVSLTIDVIAIYLSGYPAAMEQLAEGLKRMAGQTANHQETMMALMAPVMRAALLMLAMTIPCYLLMWYSPIFAGIHRRGLVKSLVFSIIAVCRNLPAFLCHAFCLAAFVMLMAMLMTMLPGGAPGANMLFSPYMLLIVPIVFSVIVCSQWACYLDTVTRSPEKEKTPEALPPAENDQH